MDDPVGDRVLEEGDEPPPGWTGRRSSVGSLVGGRAHVARVPGPRAEPTDPLSGPPHVARVRHALETARTGPRAGKLSPGMALVRLTGHKVIASRGTKAFTHGDVVKAELSTSQVSVVSLDDVADVARRHEPLRGADDRRRKRVARLRAAQRGEGPMEEMPVGIGMIEEQESQVSLHYSFVTSSQRLLHDATQSHQAAKGFSWMLEKLVRRSAAGDEGHGRTQERGDPGAQGQRRDTDRARRARGRRPMVHSRPLYEEASRGPGPLPAAELPRRRESPSAQPPPPGLSEAHPRRPKPPRVLLLRPGSGSDSQSGGGSARLLGGSTPALPRLMGRSGAAAEARAGSAPRPLTSPRWRTRL